jgi:SAM-dependent methyltransferase
MRPVWVISQTGPHANVFVRSRRPVPLPPRDALYGPVDRGGMKPKGPSMANERPVYEGLADKYAATVDSKPQHAAYERPAMLSLLPEVAGRDVLDVGCGSGWYAEHLLGKGASVTSFDVEPRFVELTRSRIGERGVVLQADLSQPLGFASDGDLLPPTPHCDEPRPGRCRLRDRAAAGAAAYG